MLRVMPQNWSEEQTKRIAQEIRQLRGSRSAQWLADRTAELGCAITRSVIADLENGRRKYVAVHELIVLAEALSVSPLELLYGNDNGALIEYVPGDQVQRTVAVQQFSGINEATLTKYEETIAAMTEAAEAALKSSAMAEAAAKLMRNITSPRDADSEDEAGPVA